MPRQLRACPIGIPQHIIQRGKKFYSDPFFATPIPTSMQVGKYLWMLFRYTQ